MFHSDDNVFNLFFAIQCLDLNIYTRLKKCYSYSIYSIRRAFMASRNDGGAGGGTLETSSSRLSPPADALPPLALMASRNEGLAAP